MIHKEDLRCIPRCQIKIPIHYWKIRSSVSSSWKSTFGRLEVEVLGAGAGLTQDEGGALGADWSAEVLGTGRGSCSGRSWGRGSVCPSPLMVPHSGLRELCAPFQSRRIGKADALSHSSSLEHSTPQPTSKPAESQHFLQPVGG